MVLAGKDFELELRTRWIRGQVDSLLELENLVMLMLVEIYDHIIVLALSPKADIHRLALVTIPFEPNVDIHTIRLSFYN